jgi:hypothetical protein
MKLGEVLVQYSFEEVYIQITYSIRSYLSRIGHLDSTSLSSVQLAYLTVLEANRFAIGKR